MWSFFYKTKGYNATHGINPELSISNNMDISYSYFMDLDAKAIFCNSSLTNMCVSYSMFHNISSPYDSCYGGGAIFFTSSHNFVTYGSIFQKCLYFGDPGGQAMRIRNNLNKSLLFNCMNLCGTHGNYYNTYVLDNGNVNFQENNVTNNIGSQACCSHISPQELGYLHMSRFIGNNATSSGIRSYPEVIYSYLTVINNNITSEGLFNFGKKIYLQFSIIFDNKTPCTFHSTQNTVAIIYNCSINQVDNCLGSSLTSKKYDLNPLNEEPPLILCSVRNFHLMIYKYFFPIEALIYLDV